MSGPDDLVAHVHDRSVVVIGGGVAGLVAAWECARVGMTVTVLDAADALGGTAAALDEFGEGDEALRTVLHLLGVADTDAAEPDDVLLGIPANPWADDVRRAIGWSGVWRAYLDRLRPPLTIGREPSLGALVRRRMGERVADRLVAPRARARWESALDDLDADATIPGISAALTRTGSLSGAVAQLAADAAPARRRLRGGIPQLVATLEAHLGELGADVRTSHQVSALTNRDGLWSVTAADEAIDADAVVVATGVGEARRLLAPFGVDPGDVDEVAAGQGAVRPARGTGRRVGDPARVAAARGALAAHPGLHAVGGWLGGGELDGLVSDAVRTAERVRHDLLWGDQPGVATP